MYHKMTGERQMTTTRLVLIGLVAVLAIVLLVPPSSSNQRQRSNSVTSFNDKPNLLETQSGESIAYKTKTEALKARQREIPAKIVQEYGLDRNIQEYGLGPKYIQPNQHNDEVARRKERMALLDKMKLEHCGGFEDFVQSGFVAPGNWSMLTDIDTFYCGNSKQYRLKETCPKKALKRSLCSGYHPERKNVRVVVERIGPFLSRGGYDWNVVAPNQLKNVGNLTKDFLGKDISVVGGMVAPVFVNGSIIGHPPLHIHHAHIYPFGDWKERANRIRGSMMDSHDVMFQSHGDSECTEEEGGVACLLHELPEGLGFVVNHSLSGLGGDFEVNDVRPRDDLNPIGWFFEVVVMYTETMPKQKATFLGLNNPCWGPGPCTYTIPFDSNNVVMWFNYTHQFLPKGTLKNFLLHTHQTIADSMYLIKGKNVYHALEPFRKNLTLPLLLDCLNKGTMDLQSAKDYLLKTALGASHKGVASELICEMSKPGLKVSCPDNMDPGKCRLYDKRVQLNCLEEVRLNPGDVLTVIAFNSVRHSHLLNRTAQFDEGNSFSKFYTGYQHSIFRGDFVADKFEDETPPSLFHYGKLPKYPDTFWRTFKPETQYDRLICTRPISLSFNST